MSKPTSYIYKQRYIPPAIKVKEIMFYRPLTGVSGKGTGDDGEKDPNETYEEDDDKFKAKGNFILWEDPWENNY